MMRLINWVVDIFSLVLITLMIVIDYFPGIGIEMKTAVIGVVVSILLSALIRRKGGATFQSGKQQFIFTVLIGGYIFILFQVLTRMGGVSERGIGVDDPLLWIVYIFSVFLAFRKYKREEASAE